MTALDLISQGEVDGVPLHSLKDFIPPIDHIGCFRAAPLLEQKFGKVMECRHLVVEGNVIQAICDLTGCWPEFLLYRNSHEFLGFWHWMELEMKGLVKKEESLRGEPDPDLSAAGIERMEVFAEYNLVDMAAMGDITKWDDVEGMPYQKVLTKALMNKISGEVSKKYRELKAPKK